MVTIKPKNRVRKTTIFQVGTAGGLFLCAGQKASCFFAILTVFLSRIRIGPGQLLKLLGGA